MAVPTPAELRDTAEAHWENAKILRDAGKYDGAVYLCGYAVEIALKARICQVLNWPTFPPAGNEDFKSVFTHKIEPLLWFSGAVAEVKPKHLPDWAIIKRWDPELRYYPVGSKTAKDADETIMAAATLLKILL